MLLAKLNLKISYWISLKKVKNLNNKNTLHLTVSNVASRTHMSGMIIPVGIRQSTVMVGGIKWCPHSSPEEGGIMGMKEKLSLSYQLLIFLHCDRCISKGTSRKENIISVRKIMPNCKHVNREYKSGRKWQTLIFLKYFYKLKRFYHCE